MKPLGICDRHTAGRIRLFRNNFLQSADSKTALKMQSRTFGNGHSAIQSLTIREDLASLMIGEVLSRSFSNSL